MPEKPMDPAPMDQAINAAIELNEEIGRRGIKSAYSELEKAVRSFEKNGYPLESIIPHGEDTGLGFSLRRTDGKTFFAIYSSLIHKKLCKPGGEFNKLIKTGIDSSVGAVLTAIVTSLGIPLVALSIMIPIAVIIFNTGIEAFCKFTEEEKKP
jgi:hypothetical protein